MISLRIKSKTYHIPEDWRDVKIGTFVEAERLIKDIPETLTDAHFGEGENSLDKLTDGQQAEVAKYQRRFIAHFTDVPMSLLKQIPLKDISDQSFGISTVYNSISFLAGMPERGWRTPAVFFKFKGKKYMRREDIGGVFGKITNKEATSEEAIEQLQLKQAIQQLTDGSFKTIPYLAATVYRPVVTKRKRWLGMVTKKYKAPATFDVEQQEKLAKKFKDLPMIYGWDAFFLLTDLSERLQKAMPRYLRKSAASQRKGDIVSSLAGLAG